MRRQGSGRSINTPAVFTSWARTRAPDGRIAWFPNPPNTNPPLRPSAIHTVSLPHSSCRSLSVGPRRVSSPPSCPHARRISCRSLRSKMPNTADSVLAPPPPSSSLDRDCSQRVSSSLLTSPLTRRAPLPLFLSDVAHTSVLSPAGQDDAFNSRASTLT